MGQSGSDCGQLHSECVRGADGAAGLNANTPWFNTQYTNNQWLGTGASYFPNGNLKTLSMRTFTYDGENRLVGSTQPNTGAIWYAYDGAGRRVQKTLGSTVTTYVYDGSGQLAAESTNVASTGASTEYLIGDILGSTRAILDGTGSAKEWIDYLPFGEEIPSGVGQRGSGYSGGVYPWTTDIASQKFTGKERDAETGLDYFGARYMSSAQGRFTSPDPMTHPSESQLGELGFLSDPQRWNKYAYTRNNPLVYVDPDGRETQATLGDRDTREAGYVIGNLAGGFAIGIANVYIGIDNRIRQGLNLLGASYDEIPQIQPQNSLQEFGSQVGMAVAIPGPKGERVEGGSGRQSLTSLAGEVREAGGHPAAQNQRTIAVGENSEGELFAGSSNGFDRGQRQAAQARGVKCVSCKDGAHAEENLMWEVPDLKRVGTSRRSPCGPSEHNCAGQLAERGVQVENK
jgi:RHS repeat-associated protein